MVYLFSSGSVSGEDGSFLPPPVQNFLRKYLGLPRVVRGEALCVRLRSATTRHFVPEHLRSWMNPVW